MVIGQHSRVRIWSGIALFVGMFAGGLGASRAQAQVERLYDNAEAAPHLAVINSAKTSIEIEIYEMSDLKVLAALQAAVKRGVHVRVLQEPNPLESECLVFQPPTPHDSSDCTTQKKFVRWLNVSGGAYLPFNTKAFCSPTSRSCFEHGKILIADSQMALISSGNFNPSNLCDKAQNNDTCNRDYSVVTRDPNVVQTLRQIFESDFQGKPYDLTAILRAPSARRVTVSPYSMPPLIALIESAKKSILIQNQYLHDPTLNQALIDAARRGVQVFVDVESVCNFDRPDAMAKAEWTKIFSAFDAVKIQSRMFNEEMSLDGLKGYLHAKAILVDGTVLWIGSVNGSTQSLTVNREFGLFLNDSESVQRFSQKFAADFKHPLAETWPASLACQHDHPKTSRGPIGR